MVRVVEALVIARREEPSEKYRVHDGGNGMLRSNTLRTVESRVLLAHEYAHLGLDSGRFDAIDEPEASCTLTPWPPWRSADTAFIPEPKLSLSFMYR